MKVGRKPSTGAKVLELLKEIGPMSAREIADFLGVRIQDINCAIRVMRRAHEERGEPKMLYVEDWEFPSRPHGGRENIVWALGDKPDKKRPKPNRRAAQKRYDERRYAIERIGKIAASGNPFASLIAQVA